MNRLVKDRKVGPLIRGYMAHMVDEDGVLTWIREGISSGCPLSPLMGAIYLKPLDAAMEGLDVFYALYMDDWVVLAETRWKLKQAVKGAHEALEILKVEKHPFKTFVGWVVRGFDFLGYRFTPSSADGLEIAGQTINNHVDKIARFRTVELNLAAE